MRRIFVFALGVLASLDVLSAAVVRGVVVDSNSGEPLIGATVMVKDSFAGTATGLDGDFTLNVGEGQSIVISYISYLTQELTSLDGASDLRVLLKPNTQELAAVEVVVKANMETEANLQNERIASSVAIENIGVKEMSLKGLSNAEDGVKKITGVTIADAGEVIVRGLGDRYSLTTLNGVPIASPNPDKKLIPLDIFPSSAIQNITVSKVYRVDNFADYSGALIDIATRNLVTSNYFNVSLSVGGNTATTGKDFYVSDRGSLFKTPSQPSNLAAMSSSEYGDYITSAESNPFDTDFSISKRSALPDFGGQIGMGRKWSFSNGHKLDVLLSGAISNSRSTTDDAFIRTNDNDGKSRSYYDYNSYTTKLESTGLASIGYTMKNHSLGYTSFYSRNVEDNYKFSEGIDEENEYIFGSNSTMRIYSLFTNQLRGEHSFGDKWDLDWTFSLSSTSSDEPDRKQILYYEDNEGYYVPYSINAEYTNRYFAELDEDEYVANVATSYQFLDSGKLKFGGAYRDKKRDYTSSLYTYNYRNSATLTTYRPQLESVYDTDGYIDHANVVAGNIFTSKIYMPTGTYSATSDVAAAFVDVDYTFGNLLVNLGMRYESSNQWVEYWEDGKGWDEPSHSELSSNDIFPAMNLKYNFSKGKSLRFAASKSVTRPSFIEMSPFSYQESYGSASIVGNADIQNGYNYNFDLRYDYFAEGSSDMFSLGAYYKILDSPIERIQRYSGGSTVYSFMNSESGYAAGLEVEVRKQFLKNFRVGANASYILTEVVLEEGGGIYTDTERQLQGASPYLINADLSYTLRRDNDRMLTAALVYSIEGPRIDGVGILGAENIMQQEIQELNLVCSYTFNSKLSMSLKLENLLNYPTVFTQEDSTGREIEVGRYTTGIDASIGLSYKF